MKSPEEIAGHPKACLHRDLVARLRAFGSKEGAGLAWARFRANRSLWKKIATYGLAPPDRQRQLNQIAFPNSNWKEVDAALQAGNNLRGIYDLASGNASLARDPAGRYKIGAKGLKIIRQWEPTSPSGSKPH
jgi:hypothetical protein